MYSYFVRRDFAARSIGVVEVVGMSLERRFLQSIGRSILSEITRYPPSNDC
ncbi:MAG TPA: hypothetical protein VMX16_17260 [Terriglobia bacterium]|nr:hypothetical protein [Terriglobia bacterium]